MPIYTIKDLTFDEIPKLMIGKKFHFTANCEFLPDFDIVATVKSVRIRNGIEAMIETSSSHGNTFTIAGNMKGLKAELLS